jgi:hypothetical protein
MEELKSWVMITVSLVMLVLLTVLVVRAVRYMGRVERHLSSERRRDIANLHDWLLLPPEMRRGSAGAAVVLGEIAANYAELLAACEAFLACPPRDRHDLHLEEIVRAALAKAKGA